MSVVTGLHNDIELGSYLCLAAIGVGTTLLLRALACLDPLEVRAVL
jgi:hypothetical protein